MMRTLISMISLMVVLGLGAAASAATITVDTDKKTYLPGESITVTTTLTITGAECPAIGDGSCSQALLELLWNDRRGRHLHHEAYDAMGEVQGAIARHAETVFERLKPPEQERARKIFLQLVRPEKPGEATGDTRRRATFAELGEEARPLVKTLADARLVVTARDETTGAETAERTPTFR